MKKEVEFEYIPKFKESYPIKDMCEYFNIQLNGYYAFTKKKYKPSFDKMLMNLIENFMVFDFKIHIGV